MLNIYSKTLLRFIYLFLFCVLTVVGLCCCMQAFSSCGWRGLLFVVVCRLLIAVASLVVDIGSRSMGLSSCGVWVQ